MVWRSGNDIWHINKVTLCWAQLVLGWVTTFEQANPLSISPRPTQPPTLSASVSFTGL